MNTTSNKPLFSLGKIVATPGALELLQKNNKTPAEFIAEHHAGNWGDALCDEDKQLNNAALKDGSRLLSAFTVGNDKLFWVITEADRSSTTLLLPSEY